MPRLSTKNKKLIANIVRRWAHTINGTAPESIENVRAAVSTVYRNRVISKWVTVKPKKKKKTKKKETNATAEAAAMQNEYTPKERKWTCFRCRTPKIHVVHSPVAFRIAAAVLRGRVGKAEAVKMCAAYGIDASFVAGLKRDAMLRTRVEPSWRDSSVLASAWEKTLRLPIRGAIDAAFSPDVVAGPQSAALALQRSRQRQSILGRADELREKYARIFAEQFVDLPAGIKDQTARQLENSAWDTTIPTRDRGRNDLITLGNFWQEEKDGALASAKLAAIPHSSDAMHALHCRMASSGTDSRGWGTHQIDAEVLCRGMGLTHSEHIWQRELLHAAPLTMTFNTQVLVLLGRPVTHKNRDGELHCDTGPAVVYKDGAKQYWLNGHELGVLGQKIVERPHEITLTDISDEMNEEVKRIAIEKYGWGRYLTEKNAVVLDQRQNDVDNTFEALVAVQEKATNGFWDSNRQVFISAGKPITRHRLVLACRSTGRQYFLAVPETVTDCESGQNWLHEGANSSSVDVMRHPVRLLGAS